MRINGETIRAKEHRREEEKMADLRDLEYTKNKMVRLKKKTHCDKPPRV